MTKYSTHKTKKHKNKTPQFKILKDKTQKQPHIQTHTYQKKTKTIKKLEIPNHKRFLKKDNTPPPKKIINIGFLVFNPIF